MINLVNVPGRTSRTEMTANLDRKKNGYKMSNKAKAMLGISHDSASKLAIGEKDGILWIKAVSENEPSNAHVSKLNMINKNGVVNILDKFGNHFTITDTVEEGFHKLEATTKELSTDTEDTDTVDTDIENTHEEEVEEVRNYTFSDEEEDDFA